MENSRQVILDVTIRHIMAHEQVRVARVAKEAGVTPGLIYRYFSSREDLVGAAYRDVVRGYIEFDLAETKALAGLPYEEFFDGLNAIWLGILSPERRMLRLARINALGHLGRIGEDSGELSPREISGYQDYVDSLADSLGFNDSKRRSQLSSMVLILLSLPLGFTTLGGDALPQSERDSVSVMLTGIAMDFLARNEYEWPSP